MKKFLKVLSLLLVGLPFITYRSAQAQSLDTLFVDAPTTLFPVVDKAARLDLIDLYNHGIEAKVENIFGGQSELTKKTPNFLSLRTTDVSTWEMHLLPCAKDTLILSLHTLVAGSQSTDVQLYTLHWTPVKDKLPHPQFEQFVRPDSPLYVYDKQYLTTVLTEQPLAVTLSPQTSELTYRISTEGLSTEDKEKAKQYIQPLVYEWKEAHFVPKH